MQAIKTKAWSIANNVKLHAPFID